MFKSALLTSVLVISLISPAFANDTAKPDDTVSFDLSTENWVATKTAHVVLDVEAAVSAATAGSIRADMTKNINDAIKADWKLTTFNRVEDQTGLERWSINFEARVPEAALNNLADTVKRASKAGVQITVASIDFTPTLEETEAVRASLRGELLKEAADQLSSLNTTIPGRAFRISQIAFETSVLENSPRPRMMKPMTSVVSSISSDSANQPEHAQKLEMRAHIVMAALPPLSAPVH